MSLNRRQVLSLLAGGALGALPLTTMPAWWSGSRLLGRGDDTTAFLAACRAGDLAAVRTWLDEEATLARATDASGRSAFVLAHLAGQLPVAELLAERGLELDVVEAVLARDWERVTAWIEADPELANRAHPIGGSPLYAAALGATGELYRLRSLGCDSNAAPPGGSGFTPARAAVDGRSLIGARLSASDVLSNGGHVNAPQKDGDSVLHGAVRRQDEALVRLVVRKGADVHARDAGGRTPLDLARQLAWSAGEALLAGERDLVRDHSTSRYLYDGNRQKIEFADLNDVPQELQSRVTGMSHARLDAVRPLVENDPRLVFSISTDDEVAIEACGHTGQKEILRFHVDHGAPLSLPSAISLGDIAHARFLLEEDPRRVHERGPHDYALMFYPAIGGGSVEMAELLLEFGAPVDQATVGLTGLHWACRRGHQDLAAFLIESGAPLDAVGYTWDAAGQTPLQVAREHGREELARLLIDRGARA